MRVEVAVKVKMSTIKRYIEVAKRDHGRQSEFGGPDYDEIGKAKPQMQGLFCSTW